MDEVRVRSVFGTPDLARLVTRLARRLERGRPLTGTLALVAATPGERAAVAAVLGRPVGTGASLRIPLDVLAAQVRDAGVAPDLHAVVEVLTGPVADVAGAQARERTGREALVATLWRGRHAGTGWYDAWVEALVADGTLTRLLRRGHGAVVGRAVAVLDALPADDVPLPVLAQRSTGDTKALSATPLAALVLRALALRAGSGVTRPDSRTLWASAGVVLDDLASQVLVLGVRAREHHVVADWLNGAADRGIPFRLTLHQLRAEPVTPRGPELFVCENPAVLRVAAAELGPRCAPLVCTEGEPSAACRRLVAAAAGAGVRVHWRGDLDWTGVRTTATAVTRYGALPWRMTGEDYETALRGAPDDDGERGEQLRGHPCESTWDGGALTRSLTVHGRAVMEEQLLPHLLCDLADGR